MSSIILNYEQSAPQLLNQLLSGANGNPQELGTALEALQPRVAGRTPAGLLRTLVRPRPAATAGGK